MDDTQVKPNYITAKCSMYKKLRELQTLQRKKPTRAERVMWEHLRNKKCGFKIRRQHIIDRYIVDFVCLSVQLIIEIDGEIHRNQKEQDLQRTERLIELGYEVMRFSNKDVSKDPNAIFVKIKERLEDMNQ